MAGLSDLIAEFLISTIGEDDKVQISRNSLAEHFACAPSQINYVLSTRFNTDTGYLVESKRGGSGYITLIKLSSDREEYLKEIIDEVKVSPISENRANAILLKLVRDGIITDREKRIIFSGLVDKCFLTKVGRSRDMERSVIFKNILIQLLKEE